MKYMGISRHFFVKFSVIPCIFAYGIQYRMYFMVLPSFPNQQSRQSTRLFLQSSDLGPPPTPSPTGECVPSPFGTGSTKNVRKSIRVDGIRLSRNFVVVAVKISLITEFI